MDESDAALDNSNIKNLVRFIQTKVDTTKFIMITSHKSCYFHANALIGITSEVSSNFALYFAISHTTIYFLPFQPDVEGFQSAVFSILLNEYRP